MVRCMNDARPNRSQARRLRCPRFAPEALESRFQFAALNPADVALSVNFQPAGVLTPTGSIADTGAAFGPRGGGWAYGWNADNSAHARLRRSSRSPDLRHDTLTHMQKPGNPDARWEVALPNGTYAVRVLAGDPTHADSVYRINVEGVLAVDAKPTGRGRWAVGEVTVRVADGRLTVSNTPGSRNNKICAIDIAGVPTPEISASGTEPVAAAPAAPAAPANLHLAWAGANTLHLRWADTSTDETGFALDRSADPNFGTFTTFSVGHNVTDFNDTSLPDGTTFHYRVRSFNAGGASGNSATLAATTQLASPYPLSAQVSPAGGAVGLKWRDRSVNESGFRVERAEAGWAWETVATMAANTNSYVDRGALSGANYAYRVVAFNAATASAPSLARARVYTPPKDALLREQWTGLPGGLVSDLTSSAAFPAAPSSGAYLSNFEAPANAGDQYGTRLRGYVTAPQTGAYRFFIAADGAAELHLSNDADPANKQLAARSGDGPRAARGREWSFTPAQQSADIRLVAGQKYYIEALHKEAGGADHLAVAWRLPDGTFEGPIPGSRLAPLLPNVRLFVDESATAEGGGPADAARFTVTRDDDFGRDLVVNYAMGGAATNGADYAALSGRVTIPKGASSATFSAVPIDDAANEGRETVTATLTPGATYALGAPSQMTGLAAISDNDNLPAGTAVISPAVTSFTSYGATRQNIAVTGMPFNQAIRVTNTTHRQNVWDIQVQQRNAVPLAQDDVMLLSFWARSGDPADSTAYFQVVFETAGPPHDKSVTYNGVAGLAWKRFDVPFPMHRAYAAQGAVLGFQIGFDPQTIDIGGVTLTNYAKQIAVGDLPRTPTGYQGREAAAAWREAAERRIEQHRKADLNVVVRDAAGNPVHGAAVSVKLTEHAFGFGTAVAADGINNAHPTDGPNYRQVIKDYYNAAVLENDLKWPGWQGNPQKAVNAIDWLHANGIDDVRGHNLIWPSWRHIPASPGITYGGVSYRADPNKHDSQEEYEAHVTVDGAAAANAWLRQRVRDHIAQEAGHPGVKGRISDWDVINEPYSEHDVQDLLGNLEMVEWFKIAKQADPNARMFLNDYPSLGGGPHLDAYEQTLRFLLDNGAPLEGIGFQGHFGGSPVGMDRVLQTYDRFASAFGLPMQVTEFDTTVGDLQLQADYLRDFLTLSFSHPDIDKFLMWGFWEGRHWLPEAALWRRDWSIKPNGQAWVDLTQREWTTETAGATRADGTYGTRGFMGEYEITVTVGGATKTVTAYLPAAGATVEVRMG